MPNLGNKTNFYLTFPLTKNSSQNNTEDKSNYSSLIAYGIGVSLSGLTPVQPQNLQLKQLKNIPTHYKCKSHVLEKYTFLNSSLFSILATC